MLHEVSLPTCIDELERLVRFQRRVLAFACDPTTALPLDEAGCKGALGEDAGAWFWQRLWNNKRKKTAIHKELEKLITFLQANPAQRVTLLDAFDNDVQFHERADDPSFRFHSQTALGKAAFEAVTPLMKDFYNKLLSNGFPPEVHEGNGTLDRDAFISAFWAANPEVKICPGCDGDRAEISEGKHYEDADHTFPKSKYPFLSLHGHNLLPLCIHCNRSFKLDRNPIDDNNHAPLTNTFLPYERPAEPRVHVTFSRSRNTEPRFRIVERNTRKTSRRIHSLNRVYRLEKRWRGRINTSSSIIEDELQNAAAFPGTLGRDGFRDYLENVKENWAEDVGSRRYALLKHAYLEYALNNDKEFEELYNTYCLRTDRPSRGSRVRNRS